MEQRLSVWRIALNITVTIIFTFLLLPSVITAIIAFGNSNEIVFPPSSYSLDLFRRFFSEVGWVSSTWLSLRVAVVTTVLSLLVGIPAAYALTRRNFPGRRILVLFLLSPVMVPHIAVALALYMYFIRIGLNNGILRIVFAHLIATIPFVIVTASAGLKQIDPALERAATVMGASPITVLRRVTLPLLTPSIVASGLFAFLISFDEVVITWFVARAGDITLPVKMFSSIQFEVSPVLAAISTMLTALSVFICVVVAALQKDTRSAQ
jgi:putative spermidine/putrescine transport system permease protein